MVPYGLMFSFCDMVSGCNDIQLKSHVQWHSWIIKLFFDIWAPRLLSFSSARSFHLRLYWTTITFLLNESVGSQSLSRKDTVMLMLTDSCVRIDPRLTTQRFNHIQRNDTPKLSFTGGTVNCLVPFYFQLTGSSGWFGDMIILTARFSFPNPPKSVLFFFSLLLLAHIHFPV